MENKISPQIQTHIDAMKLKIIESIDNTSWIEYENNIKQSLKIFKDSVNHSISPNSSIIIKELYSLLIQTNFILLNNNYFERAIKLISDVYNIYSKRDKSNEVSTAYDAFFSDSLLFDFDTELYERINPNDYKNFRELVNTLPMIEYLIELIKLFNFEDTDFNSTISYFIESIFKNEQLSDKDKQEIIIRTLKEIDHYTRPLLSEFDVKNKAFDQDKCNNFYIQELATILRLCYLRDNLDIFVEVFNLKNERFITSAKIQSDNYKQITSILIMYIITDLTHEYSYKKKFLQSIISYSCFSNKLIDCFRASHSVHDCDIKIWSPYFNMTALVDKWKMRTSGLTTFDHSPEIFYILYLVFFINYKCYAEFFIEYPIKVGRADRFDVYSKKFIDHLNNIKEDKIINDFILAFKVELFDEYKKLVLSNLNEIVPQLEKAIKLMNENQND